MELLTFLFHFLYIGGTFFAGVILGWLSYEKVFKKLQGYLYKTKKEN